MTTVSRMSIKSKSQNKAVLMTETFGGEKQTNHKTYNVTCTIHKWCGVGVEAMEFLII